MKNLQFAKAVRYFTNESEDDYRVLNQLMYLADKTHLEKYGRFISESLVWHASKHGPFAILANQSGLELVELDWNEFSESDLECIQQVIREFYTGKPRWYLTFISKDGAWKIAWDKRQAAWHNPIIEDEDIIDQFNNCELLKDYLKENGKRMG